jgi:hypothetical protein
MRICAVIELFNESSASPDNWFRVDDLDNDGGFTLVCKRDVSLCLSPRPVVVEKKPYSRMQVTYSSTIISWIDLPVMPSQAPKDHAEILAAAKKQLAAL